MGYLTHFQLLLLTYSAWSMPYPMIAIPLMKRGLTIAAALGAVALTVVLATVVARTLDPVPA